MANNNTNNNTTNDRMMSSDHHHQMRIVVSPTTKRSLSNLYYNNDAAAVSQLLFSSSSSTPSGNTTGTNKRQRRFSGDDVITTRLTVRRRCVQFELSAVIAYPSNQHDVISPDLKEIMWYSRRELNEMKDTAKRFCAIMNLDYELQETYASCSSSSEDEEEDEITTTENNNNRTNNMIMTNNNNNTNDYLDSMSCQLLSKSLDFQQQRGLERWSSRDHYRARGLFLLCCKTAFFLEQSRQIMLGIRDPVQLALIYRTASQPAVRFARLLANAGVDILRTTK
jgi:hypothetical protein